ncbi:MAG: ankyrin repeat domain-containing protein [Comamonas sp.]|uniref:ankyrin repeat domain-containing protein n=1 Tax=Comamonas sp. TaxID=34028 RepID=UPI002FC9D902
MSTLPLPEAILLEVHQSLGGDGYATNKKNKFATGQISSESHKAMGQEILQAIFKSLDMDPQSQLDALGNFMEFANAYKFIELNTWTFGADERQVLWELLIHFYVPGLARRVGFWSLSQVMDKGMPGGRFWYLPEPHEVEGTPSLYLPVAQVVDWLLDLLGLPLEELAGQRGQATNVDQDSLKRSLYNWRNATPIRPDTIDKYFADGTELEFQGAFLPDHSNTPAQQFAEAIAFVKRKELTAEKLRLEIPITQPGCLEAILDGQVDEEVQTEFVRCLAERYAAPTLRTIRQRLLLARAVQDGYIRLLKILCPGVDRQCADPHENKLLQLFAIYKLVYNLTVDAWRHCGEQGEAAENAWFEEHLPEWDKHGLFLSILPSRRETANQALAHMLSRRFYEMQAGAQLEDYIALDAHSALPIIQRNVKRAAAFADEINTELRLAERMKTSSPWRALQGEHCYWVISQVALDSDLSPKAKEAAIQRLRELAANPAQTVQAIVLELNNYLNGDRKHWSSDTRAKVQVLLEEAEASEGYALWKAAVLQYKAKHLLACNDFDEAGKLFKAALNTGLERNYGPLRGEVARDCWAVELANQKLNANNQETYYRAMLAGGMMVDCEEIPPLEETARWVADYFWDTLYKPYPGVPAEVRRVKGEIEKLFKELMPAFMSGDQGALQSWIKANRSLLKSQLPDVEGNSVLMALLKLHNLFKQKLPLMRQMIPTELVHEVQRFESMLANWQQFFVQLAVDSPLKQLNMPDLKGQTPLMLMAEDGDTEMVRVMLQAGADPEIQDWKGMTALHSACKSRIDSCVDVLLDHPCQLDKLTDEERSPLHTACWAGHVHAVKRLVELAPGLAWKRDSFGDTPLELAEQLIEQPDALKQLAQRLAQDGKRCASKQELEAIVQLLESVAPVH